MEFGRDHRDGPPSVYPPHERMIKIPGRRPVTDYNSSMIRWMRHRRPLSKGGIFLETERPSASYVIDMVPPAARPANAVDTIPCKYLHTSSNKEKHAINIVRWTPEGRRCLTCSASGEFTLWNGTAFNFETLMQAHDHSIRAASYSHDGEWLVSGDMSGVIRYHNRDYNRVNDFSAHNDCIRDLAFSPNDSKFVSASDDATLKIFDFSAAQEDQSITGHSWEAKTVDWHPTKGLLVSGSKDHQVKLWDPRSGRCLTTLHGHKNTIVKTSFDPHRGQLLATCARDNVARIFDLRMMRDVCLLRGHNKEITTLTWHPIHANLMTTAGHDGSILHYLLDEPHTPAGTTSTMPPYDAPDPSAALAQTIWPAHRVDNAHSLAVWSLAWHPLGHILSSGGNDRCTRFWTRARPGEGDEVIKDAFHLGEQGAEAQGTWSRAGARAQAREQEERELQDEEEGLVDQAMPGKAMLANGMGLPGLPGLGESGPPGLGGSDMDMSGSAAAPQSRLAALQAQGLLPPEMLAPAMPPMLPGQAGMGGMPGNPFMGLPPEEFMKLVQEGKIPPPPQPGMGGIPPPPPGFGAFPPGFAPPPPPGFQMPQGLNGGAPTGVLPGMGLPGMPGFEAGANGGANGNGEWMNGNGAGSDGGNGLLDAAGRRRAPLPSQKDGFKAEQNRGNFRVAR